MPRIELFIAVMAAALSVSTACSDETGPLADAAPPADMKVKADQEQPDLPKPDLPVPDLQPPDQEAPDQMQPDQMQPDQMQPDQMQPDQMQPDQMQPDQMQPDQMQPDQMQPDQMQPDQKVGPPGKEKVLYMSGSYVGSQNVYTINSDGSGQAAYPGMPTLFKNIPMGVLGLHDWVEVDRTAPSVYTAPYTDLRRINLPGKLGQLFCLQVQWPTTYRVFWQVTAAGKSTLLASAPGYYAKNQTFSEWVAFRSDGKLFATPVATEDTTGKARLVLIRTDGNKFGNGTSSCDITPNASGVTYNSFNASGVVFASGWVYYFARDASSANLFQGNRLFRVKDDCSGKPGQVALPKVGGKAAEFIDQMFARVAGGKFLALHAGPGHIGTGRNKSSRDLLIVDTATGAAVNFTDNPGTHRSWGRYRFRGGEYTYRGRGVDISPKGTHVAWLEGESQFELMVRRRDKSAKAVQVTDNARFDATMVNLGSVVWANDDDLLFWVGSAAYDMGLFAYKVSTGKVTNLTQNGPTTAPFKPKGNISPVGAWLSPNRKYLHYLQHQRVTTPSQRYLCNIRSIDLSTLGITDVTKGLFIPVDTSYITAARDAPQKVFFGARDPMGTAIDLYMFDADIPAAARKLTAFPAGTKNEMTGITPAPDGSQVAFNAGPTLAQYNLYAVDTAAALPKAVKLTNTPGYLVYSKRFTTDMKSVVYTHTHGYPRVTTFRMSSLDGKATKVLQNSGGNPVEVYK